MATRLACLLFDSLTYRDRIAQGEVSPLTGAVVPLGLNWIRITAPKKSLLN